MNLVQRSVLINRSFLSKTEYHLALYYCGPQSLPAINKWTFIIGDFALFYLRPSKGLFVNSDILDTWVDLMTDRSHQHLIEAVFSEHLLQSNPTLATVGLNNGWTSRFETWIYNWNCRLGTTALRMKPFCQSNFCLDTT